VLTVAVYAPVVGHPFVSLDDERTIAGNPHFNPPGWSGIAHYWAYAHMGLWVPVTYTLWGLLAMATYVTPPDELGVHVDPRIYHGASVLVHACAVVIAYGLLRRLLARGRLGAATATAATWGAGVGALAYALHPVQVEGVAWASGLKDVLYAALSLAALSLYVRAVDERPGDPIASAAVDERDEPRCRPDNAQVPPVAAAERRSPWRRWEYWAGLACLALAMLSKPTAMVTPALAAVLDRIVLGRPVRRVAAALWPWFALAVPVMIIAKIVQPGSGVATVAPWARPLVAGEALAFYLWKLLIPIRLAPDYGLRPIRMMHAPWIWVAWLAPALVALLLWRGRRRAPVAAAGGAFFLIAVLPMLGLTPYMFQYFSTAADHYLQLAMFGIAMALGSFAARSFSSRGARAGWVLLLCAWAGLAVRQQHWWADSGELFTHTLDVNPGSFMAHANRGAFAQSRHDYGAAERDFRAATKLNPEMMAPRSNLANLLAAEGRIDEAMAVVSEAEAVNATLPPAYRIDMSQACYALGARALEGGQPAFAERFFREQLRRTPDDEPARKGLEEARRLVAASRPATTKAAR
jgi:tetratricopeptide (TPR) repeat protein